MFGLIPKEEKFFGYFKEMSTAIVEGSQLLKELLDNYDSPQRLQQKIKDIEHKGDNITHNIINKLNLSFVTPFDREDIYDLASALDDVLDFIDASAQHMITYRVEKTTSTAKELGFIILQSCQALNRAVSALDGKTELHHISEFCVEINSLENEADRVCREAIGDLFDNEKDPLQVIKWKAIYENLETVTDKCEDAANILQSIIVKNA
jgi:predicted phosphate transport protein (TIGR00153 family)